MSFVEVSELEWASRLMGAMDFKQEFLENFTTRTTLGYPKRLASDLKSRGLTALGSPD